jgi:hypothetical protein
VSVVDETSRSTLPYVSAISVNGLAHRVPLSPQAVRILKALAIERIVDHVEPGGRARD